VTRVAFVRDWLTVYAGADRVMDAALELFPGAPVYTLIYQSENFVGRRVHQHPVHTSFIDRLPWGRRNYRTYLPLMPWAIEQFDLSGYDVVISMSHVVAKGVLTRADQLHISYVFTPMRYAWDLYFQYLRELRLTRGMKSLAVRAFLHYLRTWDVATAHRPDVMIAASEYVAQRIWKLYRRRAGVVHPPVEIDRFRADRPREDFYLTVSRFVPYKRLDLIVEAFSRMGKPLVVIGDGPERERMSRHAGPSVRLLGAQSDEVVQDFMERCRAFVFAADEDFGIVTVEAQAAGAPVIAYGRGGSIETVLPGRTGVFFEEQTVDALVATVGAFEERPPRYSAELIRDTTRRFSRTRFQEEFLMMVERERDAFSRDRRMPPRRPPRRLVAAT
jgi:glycosyltransferase involved in cell wall biosynthesis